MSNEINTQHGTIGLLMADVEQLRRDLAQAKAELGAWQSAFGTTQLSHALAAYEKVKSETELLKKCSSCGVPISNECADCKRQWES